MAWLDSEHKLWSQYRFLTQLLKAKKDYYTDGTSKLTDKQYDSLEYSFIVLHGREIYDEIVGVGYVEGSLEKYKKKLKELNNKINNRVNNG
tara:strand:+ start:734 stop:1006 length:273 start_codon:yes stop_codon:yes gene_type:complete